MPRLALRSVFLTALIPLLLAVIVAFSAVSSASRDSCDTLLKAGRYLDANSFEPKTWQPVGCSLHSYLDDTLFGNFSACLGPGDEIIVLGGRSARSVYHGLVQTLKPSHPGYLEVMTESVLTATTAGVQLRLLWAPHLNGSAVERLLDIAQNGTSSPHKAAAVKAANMTENSPPLRTFLFVTAGAEFVTGEPNFSAFSAKVEHIVEAVRASQHFEKAYFAPTMIPYYSRLEQADSAVSPEKIAKLIQFSDEYFNYDPVSQTGGVLYREGVQDTPAMHYVPVFNDLGGLAHLELYRPDTMSYIDETRSIQASILLNHMCNQRIVDSPSPAFTLRGTCCVAQPGVPAPAALAVIALVIVSAGLLGLRAQVSAASAVAVLSAGAAVASYVYATDRTNAFVHAATLYSPGPILLPLLQIIACVALLRLRPDAQPATTAHAGAGPERRVGGLLVREIQGLCLLLLLVIEVSGYDVVRDRFEGELLARVLYSSWAAAAVYDFACSYMALLCDGASHDAVKYCALRTARICFLPLLITLQSGMEDLPRSLALVSPITVKLLFWYAFVTVVAPLAFSALRLVRAHAAFAVLAARYSILLLIAMLTYFLLREAASGNQAKAATGVFDFQVDHPVLADFWVVFGAVLAAWWYYSAGQTLSETQNSAGPSLRVALSAGAALSIFVSTLYRFFRFPMLTLTGSYIVTASIDYKPRFYLQALALRGAAYTPLVHFAVCVAVLSLWLVARAGILAHTLRNSLYYYSSACLFVAACGYEMLVLRRHVLQTTPGRGLLVLLPGGLGAAHTPAAASAPAYALHDAQATDWDLLARYWLNLALVFCVFLCAAWVCSAGWGALAGNTHEEDVEEQEKCIDEC